MGHTANKIDAASIASSIGLSHGRLPTKTADLLDIFKSLAIREPAPTAIRGAVPGGIDRNDRLDVSFLLMTLAYFDVVTMDLTMAARVREAELGDLQAAPVVGRLADLGAAPGPFASR